MSITLSIRNLAASSAALVLAASAASAVAQEITVVSFGGAYQEGQSKALFQPGAKALGINLKEETYTGIADLRLKMKAGANNWDIVTSGSGSAARAGAEGILEKLDYKHHRRLVVPARLRQRVLRAAATSSRRCWPGTPRPTATRDRRAGPISGT